MIIMIVKILAENPRNGGSPPNDNTFIVKISLVSRGLLMLKIPEISSRERAEKNIIRGIEITQ